MRSTPHSRATSQIFSVRELLEGAAAELACRNCTPTLIKELAEINTELLGAINKRNVLGCLSANQRFHFMLYGASGSEVLLPLIESLWLQFGPTMYLSLLTPDMPWDASAHVEILEGLRAQKASLARRGVLNDIRTTGRALVPAMASRAAVRAVVGAARRSLFRQLSTASLKDDSHECRT